MASRPASGKRQKKSGSSRGGGNKTPTIIIAMVGAIVLIGVGLLMSGVLKSRAPEPVTAAAAPQSPTTSPGTDVSAPTVENGRALATPAKPVAAASSSVAPELPPITAVERALALRWMPSNTEILFHLKVSDTLQSPIIVQYLSEYMGFTDSITEMGKLLGVSPNDVESFTLGFDDLEGMQVSPYGLPTHPNASYIGIVRTKKAVSHDQLLENSPAIKAAEYKTKPYFVMAKKEQFGGCVVDPNTILIGPPDNLKKAMDRGETVIPRKELLIADSARQLILLVAPLHPKLMIERIEHATPGFGNEPKAIHRSLIEQKAFLGLFSSFALAINFGDGLDVQSTMLIAEGIQPSDVQTGIDAAVRLAQEHFKAMKANDSLNLNAPIAELLRRNLKIESDASTVKISANANLIKQRPDFGLYGQLLAVDLLAKSLVAWEPEPWIPPHKQPGECDPVDAESAEGLPEGAALFATTCWPETYGSADAFRGFAVNLDVRGKVVDQSCAIGEVNVASVKLTGGGSLQAAKATNTLGDFTTRMFPFDSTATVTALVPKATLRASVLYDPPSGNENSIAAFEGTFKVLTFEAVEEVTINDAPKLANRPLTDATLKAAGVKLSLSKFQHAKSTSEHLELTCGPGYFLGDTLAKKPQDEMWGGICDNWSTPTSQLLNSWSPKFPTNMQVRFKLYKGVKEHTVRFKFGSVPLPTAESNPKNQLPK